MRIYTLPPPPLSVLTLSLPPPLPHRTHPTSAIPNHTPNKNTPQPNKRTRTQTRNGPKIGIELKTHSPCCNSPLLIYPASGTLHNLISILPTGVPDTPYLKSSGPRIVHIPQDSVRPYPVRISEHVHVKREEGGGGA